MKHCHYILKTYERVDWTDESTVTLEHLDGWYKCVGIYMRRIFHLASRLHFKMVKVLFSIRIFYINYNLITYYGNSQCKMLNVGTIVYRFIDTHRGMLPCWSHASDYSPSRSQCRIARRMHHTQIVSKWRDKLCANMLLMDTAWP